MSKVDIPGLAEKLLVVTGRQLDDSSLPTDLLGLSKDVGTKAASGSINAIFGATIAVGIHLYNGADDKDDDGVIGMALARKPASAVPSIDWRPQIEITSGNAWLKYSLEAEVTARATSKIGNAGGSISGDRSLRLLCYKRHNGGEPILPAIVTDLGDVHSPLSAADVLALSIQEATALKIRGKLSATLRLSWADIFSTSMHEFAEFGSARENDPFLIKVSSSASATFTVTVDDDFTLCFVREKQSGDAAIRVALRKAVNHDRRFVAKADVQIAFADPSAVRDVLAGVMAGVLDAPAAALAAIENATSLDSVPTEYRWLVKGLAERFGFAEADPLQPVKEQLRKLDALLNDRIERVARAKVSMGFRYEYARIASEASLLEATLSEAALGELHGAILEFDFAKVLAYSGPGMDLDFFLHQRTIDRVRAYGFSLGIGAWLNIGGKQTRRDLFVTRSYVSAATELASRAYTGSTHYKANVNSWSTDYGAVFKADQEQAQPMCDTSSRNFACGLHLWWEEAKLKPESRLARIVDDAVLWGAIDGAGVAALQQRLGRALAGVSECKLRLSVMLEDQGLRQALRELADVGNEELGKHAARALPWQARQLIRASCASRETTYASFFSAYAKAPESAGNSLKQLIAASLRGQSAGLAGQEAVGETPWTLYQVLLRADANDQGFWQRWQSFREGATRLAALVDGQGDWSDFDEAFGLLSRPFEQAYLIRIVASVFARKLPQLLHDAKAYSTTMTLSFELAGKEQTIVIGGKT